MAKYRHRIFEMYEFLDETIRALTPTTATRPKEATALDSSAFQYLVVARSAGVTLVKFKETPTAEAASESNFASDFAQLADSLERDSKVVVDFTGVESFSPAAIDAVGQFRQNLQLKGSRIALCCLDPAVRESFFATASPKTH